MLSSVIGHRPQSTGHSISFVHKPTLIDYLKQCSDKTQQGQKNTKTRHAAVGQLWARAPVFLKLFSKKCVCMNVCLYICLPFRDCVSKPFTGESSPYTKN